MKILVINGPNINMLGVREPHIYGTETYDMLVCRITEYAATRGVTADCVQSNHEGAIVDMIQSALGMYDGIIINPAAYTHTSIAIPDALRAVALPACEVHISDIASREEYRRVSFVREACIATVSGHGTSGYSEAIDILCDYLETCGTDFTP